jgi:hypothetical protein
MGRPRQPGDPHAEETGALARELNPGRGGILFYPRATPLWLRPRKGEGGAATVAWAVQAGAAWRFRPTVAAPGFKSEGGEAESQLSTPPTPLGFSLSTPPERAL